MYSIFHPEFAVQPWHVFVSYLICTWICCCTVLFANRALPVVGDLGGFFILAGVLVTIIVCAVMPYVNNVPYASNDFVWKDWVNATGYTSNGFVFVAGMLNGAYAVGSTDCVTHLAEEIPRYVTKEHLLMLNPTLTHVLLVRAAIFRRQWLRSMSLGSSLRSCT